MDRSYTLPRQGHRMLQTGIALFVFSALEGFAIPSLPVPRLELSVHTLSAQQGVMLLGLGLLWPRLKLGASTSRIAFWTRACQKEFRLLKISARKLVKEA